MILHLFDADSAVIRFVFVPNPEIDALHHNWSVFPRESFNLITTMSNNSICAVFLISGGTATWIWNCVCPVHGLQHRLAADAGGGDAWEC